MVRVALFMLALGGVAHAQPADDGSDPNAPPPPPATNRINMRIGGASSDDVGRPTICLDVRVALGFGVESCGTGQGVIHEEAGTELAHFRATYSFYEHATSSGTGRLRGGLGFAELQVGVDHPGFKFGQPDAQDRGSVAGPEASIQGQWLVPIGKGVEGIASFTAGVAMFQHAEELVAPKSNVLPFVSVEVGIGW